MKNHYPPTDGNSITAFINLFQNNPFPMYSPDGQAVRWDFNSLKWNDGNPYFTSKNLPGVIRFMTSDEVKAYDSAVIEERQKTAAYLYPPLNA